MNPKTFPKSIIKKSNIKKVQLNIGCSPEITCRRGFWLSRLVAAVKPSAAPPSFSFLAPSVRLEVAGCALGSENSKSRRSEIRLGPDIRDSAFDRTSGPRQTRRRRIWERLWEFSKVNRSLVCWGRSGCRGWTKAREDLGRGSSAAKHEIASGENLKPSQRSSSRSLRIFCRSAARGSGGRPPIIVEKATGNGEERTANVRVIFPAKVAVSGRWITVTYWNV